MSSFRAICANQNAGSPTMAATKRRLPHLGGRQLQIIQQPMQKWFELVGMNECFDVSRMEAEVMTAGSSRIVKPQLKKNDKCS